MLSMEDFLLRRISDSKLNAIGDNVASMIVARMLGGKDWMKEAYINFFFFL